MFRNREEAAGLLARRLARYRDTQPLVLAVPRGAVPMARIVAEALDGDLDVVLVHKIGAPGNPEYAIGSVAETGEVALRFGRGAEAPDWYVDEVAQQELASLRRRRAVYSPDRPPLDPAGRVTIVVDDGIATGATLAAALRLVRRCGPRKLIAAVGVAPRESLAEVEALADEVVCLDTPPFFLGVGGCYEEFPQVSDDEVVAQLRGHAARHAAAAIGV